MSRTDTINSFIPLAEKEADKAVEIARLRPTNNIRYSPVHFDLLWDRTFHKAMGEMTSAAGLRKVARRKQYA